MAAAQFNRKLLAAAPIGRSLVDQDLRARKQSSIVPIAAANPALWLGHQDMPAAVKNPDRKGVHYAGLSHVFRFLEYETN